MTIILKAMLLVIVTIIIFTGPLSAQPKVEFRFTKEDKAIAHLNIGLNFVKQNQLAKAIEEFNKSLEYNPDNPDTYYNMGITYAKMENYDEAINCFNRVLESKNDDAYTYYNLGVAYSALNKIDLARQNYEKAVTNKKDFTEALANLAMIYYYQEDNTNYLTTIEKLDSLDPKLSQQVKEATGH